MTASRPKRALVLGADRAFGFAAGTCLVGFMRHNPDFDGDVIVLDGGLDPADLQALRQICPRLILRDYTSETLAARLAPYGLGLNTPALAKILQDWSAMIFAKFELFDWQASYDQLLWLDSDILVQGDIAHLWRITGLGWRGLGPNAALRRAKTIAALNLPLEGTLPIPNGGVIALGRCGPHLPATELYEKAAQILQLDHGTTPDEMALWALAQQHGLPVTPLELADNHPVSQPNGEAARLLHSIGPEKFWSSAPLWQSCPAWAENHRHWQAAGGSSYLGGLGLLEVHPTAPDQALRMAQNRALWPQVWHRIAEKMPPELWPEMTPEADVLALNLRGWPRAVQITLMPRPKPNSYRLSLVAKRGPETEALIAGIDARLGQLPDLSRKDSRHNCAWHRTLHLREIAQAATQICHELAKVTR